MNKKIVIFIVAYNAQSTLIKVLERIPSSIMEIISEIFVFDDCSRDDTYDVGKKYKEIKGLEKLNIYRNAKNLGYGGNQKAGYDYAIAKGFDYVILLHGDGQYAPEALPQLLEPAIKDEAEAIFGSRMMIPGAALKGGMPLYKFFGNKILTAFENLMLGMNLAEFHSGYRIYACQALSKIPFNLNSDDFHFDTEIIIQLHELGARIVELPVPTFYGDEICHVNGLKYAKDIVGAVIKYKFHKAGIKHFKNFEIPSDEKYVR